MCMVDLTIYLLPSRNTPQAFSHFTHYASNGTLLICDIQGVGDLYTGMSMTASELLVRSIINNFLQILRYTL